MPKSKKSPSRANSASSRPLAKAPSPDVEPLTPFPYTFADEMPASIRRAILVAWEEIETGPPRSDKEAERQDDALHRLATSNNFATAAVQLIALDPPSETVITDLMRVVHTIEMVRKFDHLQLQAAKIRDYKRYVAESLDSLGLLISADAQHPDSEKHSTSRPGKHAAIQGSRSLQHIWVKDVSGEGLSDLPMPGSTRLDPGVSIYAIAFLMRSAAKMIRNELEKASPSGRKSGKAQGQDAYRVSQIYNALCETLNRRTDLSASQHKRLRHHYCIITHYCDSAFKAGDMKAPDTTRLRSISSLAYQSRVSRKSPPK